MAAQDREEFIRSFCSKFEQDIRENDALSTETRALLDICGEELLVDIERRLSLPPDKEEDKTKQTLDKIIAKYPKSRYTKLHCFEYLNVDDCLLRSAKYDHQENFFRAFDTCLNMEKEVELYYKAFVLAYIENNNEIMNVLIERGIQPSGDYILNTYFRLGYEVYVTVEPHIPLADFLVQHYGYELVDEIIHKLGCGQTLLKSTLRHGNLEIAEYIIKNDVDVKEVYFRAYLELISKGDIEMIRMLFENNIRMLLDRHQDLEDIFRALFEKGDVEMLDIFCKNDYHHTIKDKLHMYIPQQVSDRILEYLHSIGMSFTNYDLYNALMIRPNKTLVKYILIRQGIEIDKFTLHRVFEVRNIELEILEIVLQAYGPLDVETLISLMPNANEKAFMFVANNLDKYANVKNAKLRRNVLYKLFQEAIRIDHKHLIYCLNGIVSLNAHRKGLIHAVEEDNIILAVIIITKMKNKNSNFLKHCEISDKMKKFLSDSGFNLS